MAQLAQVTVDELAIMVVDSDPSSSGVAAPIGSIALIDNSSAAQMWIKTSGTNTGWTQIPRLLAGTTLAANTLVYTDPTGYMKTDTTKFTWDPTNARLGIGLAAPATPQSTIHIDRGTGVGGHIRFTAGTTTGQAQTDGTQMGIDDTGAAEIINYENTALNFFTNNTKVGAFTAAGQFIVGPVSTGIDITGASVVPQFQILGTAAVQMAGIQYSNDTIGPVFNLLKSRGVTVGAQGLVAADDEFGRIQFRASDATNFQAGASIRALVDGTPGAGSMPGRLIFMTTPTGASAPVERMRISQNGLVRVVDALQRRRSIQEFDTGTLSNSTVTLTTASASIQIYSGTTAGQIVKMPDATTLVIGAEYEIRNNGSQTIAVQDNAGGALDTTPTSTGVTVLKLQTNATAAGTWYVRTCFEPISYRVSSSANFTTTSATDVLVTTMTVTPIAGTYFVAFDCTQTNSAGGNTNTLSVYSGGVLVTDSQRTVGTPTNFAGVIQAVPGTTTATVTVDGTQAVEVRCRRSAGTATIQNRAMTVIRIG